MMTAAGRQCNCKVRPNVASLGVDAGPGGPLCLPLRYLHRGQDGLAPGPQGNSQGIPEAHCKIAL